MWTSKNKWRIRARTKNEPTTERFSDRRAEEGAGEPEGAPVSADRRRGRAGADHRTVSCTTATARRTDDAQVDGHITPVASKIYGRVAEVLVLDNQPVKAGQVLVKIDPRDYQAALDQAKAQLALAEADAQSAGVDVPRTRENVASGTSSADAQLLGAQASLAMAQSTYEQSQTADLAYAQANIDKSKANAELAQADLARYKPLLDKGEISQQQYDAAKANADATASALKADQEKLGQAQRNVDIAKSQVAAAQARVEQTKAGVAVSARGHEASEHARRGCARQSGEGAGDAGGGGSGASLNLSYTQIIAPVDGVVTHKQVEPGQIVQQGQGLVVVVPLQDVWVTANFKETQLRNMKPGQKAEVHVDTYGKTFTDMWIRSRARRERC